MLDTNVISEPTRRSPSPEVFRWVESQNLDSLYTISLACAEIRAGIAVVADPARRASLEDWLARKVRPLFGPRVLDADEELWTTMLSILGRMRSLKRTIPVADLIFAAAAQRHGMTLVTRNLKDFAGTGVAILNPWLAEPTIETA